MDNKGRISSKQDKKRKRPPIPKKIMFVLNTSRLLIRQVTIDDLNDSIEHRADPEVCKYISDPMTIQEVKKFVGEHSKPWRGNLNEQLAMAVVLKSENKLIGELKVQHTNLTEKITEIGFRFNKKYHKKGSHRNSYEIPIQ